VKKLDFDFIKESFAKEGYTILSSNYINSTSKLRYICPIGHKHSISWGKWKIGRRCYYCFGTVKKDILDIKKLFEAEGYILLSGEYRNDHTKLDYICNLGHAHSITFMGWRMGHRCAICAGQRKPTIEEITESFKLEGYTLLSKEYVNNRTKLKYICPYGHKHGMTWVHWSDRKRCPTCAIINYSGSGNPNWKGGISSEPYCEAWKDQEYKKDIRDRDGNRCLNPCCYGADDVLSIHHIDYDKKNCKPSNLITVCRSCNTRANKDREWHKSWYQAIIINRY